MSREIKFRAWDKQNKRMFPEVVVWYRLLDDTMSIIVPSGARKSGGLSAPVWKKDDYGNRYHDMGQVIPMQYTGLKDKNGTEIYEGDIVVEDVYPDENVEVQFPYKYFFDSEMGRLSSDVEVIGNIYENPELLKENS